MFSIMGLMDLLNILLRRLRLRHESEPRYYELDESLQVMLEGIAEQEQRSPEEVASHLLREGLERRQTKDNLWQRWQSLSAREQEVAALTCLGLTNRQIASRLSLSPETIKTHIRNVLMKFDVKGKPELRHILASWDFDSWI